MSDKYILKNKIPIKCDDLIEWGRAFEKDDRIVARDEVNNADVSTVFLGVDHSFRDDHHPILFETLIFGGQHDGEMWRCSTWEEAEDQHKKAVYLVLGISIV